VKLGGSLLDLPDLPDRISAWLNTQGEGSHLFFVGCGRLGDVVREYDQQLDLGETVSHRMCLSLLSVTAEIAATRLHFPLVGEASPQHRAAVFDPRDWLHQHESAPHGPPWPRTWATTSDSLAATLAVELGSTELVLLKSSSSPEINGSHDEFLAHWAATGYVDQHFPLAARPLATIRVVSLRAGNAPPAEYVLSR
jgi:aspartokinase-like uncharacterized kinase